MYEYIGSLVVLNKVFVLSTIRELKQRRFWATYVNRKCTFFIVFAKIFGQIFCIRVNETWQREKMWYRQGILNDKRPYFRLKCVALKCLPNKLSQLVLRTLDGGYKLPLGFFRHSRYYRRWTLRKKQHLYHRHIATRVKPLQHRIYSDEKILRFQIIRLFFYGVQIPSSFWYCMHC